MPASHSRVLGPRARLVVGGVGCLPASRIWAVPFLQIINARHERASAALNSNKGFEELGAVLGKEAMVAVSVDRLPQHWRIVNTCRTSWEMPGLRKLWRTMHGVERDTHPAREAGTWPLSRGCRLPASVASLPLPAARPPSERLGGACRTCNAPFPRGAPFAVATEWPGSRADSNGAAPGSRYAFGMTSLSRIRARFNALRAASALGKPSMADSCS